MNRENFNFTPEFEDLTLASYIASPEKFFCRGELLVPTYFSSVVSSLTMSCIKSYQDQWGRIPSWEMLGQLLEDECTATDTDTKQAQEYVKKLRALTTADADGVVERIVLFCRERATLNAVKVVAKALRDGKLPPEGCTRLFEDALHIGENLDDLGYVFHHSVDQVVDKVMSPNFGVKTGLPQFDSIWKTGWAPGWLMVLLAPPKRYKTTAALNIALSVCGHGVGEDVIYYACEISQEQAALKCFFNLTGLDENFMIDSTESFKIAAKQAIQEKIAGNFVIKHFPIGTATTGMLRNHTRMLRKQLGINPKLIVVDYADTVNSVDQTEKAYIQQSNVYKEVIAMGKEAGAAVLMPDRCTADAVDKKVPDMKSFQGAFAKGGILDGAIGLCSTETEYQKNILRTFVFINRHGPAWQHYQGTVEPGLNRIDFGSSVPYDPDAEEERTPRRTGNRRNQPGIPEEFDND